MDLDHARAPNWHSGFRGGFRGGFQGHIAQTSWPLIICFNCGKEGHFTWNCFQKRQTTANSLNFADDISEMTLAPPEGNCVMQLCSELDAMSVDERMKLVQEMGVAEDFPSTWSGQHWLGKIIATIYTYLLRNWWQSDSLSTLLQKELKHSP